MEVPLVAEPILSTRDVVKVYAGFTALDGVSIDIAEQSVHAVIGPNGAGKTTFFNVLSGFAPATRGSVRFAGQEIAALDPAAIARMGMVRSFQINSVFPHLTVLDNVKIALQARTPLSRRLLASPRVTAVLDDPARAALHAVGLDDELDRSRPTCRTARSARWSWRSRSRRTPRCCCSTSRPPAWASRTSTARSSSSSASPPGRTIVLVEHNLKVVSTLADRVTVMQRGKELITGSYDEVRSDARVVSAYLGGGNH